MIIYSKTGTPLLDIDVDDTSYRYRAIRQASKVYLYYSLTDHVEIPTGSYISYQGQTYTLWSPEGFTKHGERNLEYTVEFGDYTELLNRTRYKFISGTARKLKFPLTAKPAMFLQLLVDNLNLHDSGWTIGTCIEASEKYLSFNHESCLSVLNRFCDEFNTEFELSNKQICLCKIERNKTAPLALSYGKGNGFKPGTGRANQADKYPITILYVQGGERNLDSSTYGSTSLLLPKSQQYTYQERTYQTDSDGLYVTRADRPLTVYNEDGYDATHIYPSRVGSVSEVIIVDAANNFYDIKDSSIPDALNYANCRIAGEKATIIFQTGILAGKEFDLEQTDTALTGYVHAERRFKIVPQEIDGQVMPNATFKPKVGDKYAIFNISLPQAYVCDNSSQSGASWDMLKEACQYLYENEDEAFTFSGELDAQWSKKRWLSIGGKIVPGGYVNFSDTQYQPDGVLIRIIGIKDYVNKPYSPEIELSNTPVAGYVSSDLGKLEAEEVKNDDKYKNSIQYTKRRWQDAVEMQGMLEDAFKDYGKGQAMSWLRTMSVLVGHESLQFRFVNRIPTSDTTTVSEVDHAFSYNNETKIFSTGSGIVQHLTLGIDSLSPEHKVTEYKFWNLAAYTSPPLSDQDALYLYLKCSKSAQDGTFLLSKEPLELDGGIYYNLLCGALSSEIDGERSFATLYGFSEIGPGWIRLNKIISTDGTQYWDMVNKAFRIGDANSYLDYNSNGDCKFTLKNVILQSESGASNVAGIFRGTYNSTYTYYKGDEVTYYSSGGTSTYRYINDTASKGNAPTNTTYWVVVSSQGSNGSNGSNGTNGSNGADGAYFEYRYAANSSTITPPSITVTSAAPAGWSTAMPEASAGQYVWTTVSKKSSTGALLQSWSIPTRLTGSAGPAMAYQGSYNNSTTYYGTTSRADVVYYNSSYYIARVDAGNFSGKEPTNTSYWNPFGANFESVATKLLLAENANIANMIFRNQVLQSASGSLVLDGNTGYITAKKFKAGFTDISNSFQYTSGSYSYWMGDAYNITAVVGAVGYYQVFLPAPSAQYDGCVVRFINPGITKSVGSYDIKVNGGAYIYVAGADYRTAVTLGPASSATLICDGHFWFLDN